MEDARDESTASAASAKTSSTRGTPSGSKDYDVDDIFHERLGAVSEALASSPPLVAGRKKYKG